MSNGLFSLSIIKRRRTNIKLFICKPCLYGTKIFFHFTLYNSHHEGWGLPVTESLAAGKLAVVPRHSSLVEAGEGGAVFFEPGSEPALVDTLAGLITDPAQRQAAE